MKRLIFESPMAWKRGLLIVASTACLAGCASAPKQIALDSAEAQVVWACLQSSKRVVENEGGGYNFVDGTTNLGQVSNLALIESRKKAKSYLMKFDAYEKKEHPVREILTRWIVGIQIDPCSLTSAIYTGNVCMRSENESVVAGDSAPCLDERK